MASRSDAVAFVHVAAGVKVRIRIVMHMYGTYAFFVYRNIEALVFSACAHFAVAVL